MGRSSNIGEEIFRKMKKRSLTYSEHRNRIIFSQKVQRKRNMSQTFWTIWKSHWQWLIVLPFWWTIKIYDNITEKNDFPYIDYQIFVNEKLFCVILNAKVASLKKFDSYFSYKKFPQKVFLIIFRVKFSIKHFQNR